MQIQGCRSGFILRRIGYELLKLSGGQVESGSQPGCHFKIWQQRAGRSSWHAVVIVSGYQYNGAGQPQRGLHSGESAVRFTVLEEVALPTKAEPSTSPRHSTPQRFRDPAESFSRTQPRGLPCLARASASSFSGSRWPRPLVQLREGRLLS